MREIFDYEVLSPDQSMIAIKKRHDVFGGFIWNEDTHMYDFRGKLPVTQEELFEILESLKKLNKRSVIPDWLKWGRRD